MERVRLVRSAAFKLLFVTCAVTTVLFGVGGEDSAAAQRKRGSKAQSSRRSSRQPPFVSVRTPVVSGKKTKVRVYLKNSTDHTIYVWMYSSNPLLAIPTPVIPVPAGASKSNEYDVWTLHPKPTKQSVLIHGFYYNGLSRKHLVPAKLEILNYSKLKNLGFPFGQVIGNVSITTPVPYNEGAEGTLSFFSGGNRNVTLDHGDEDVCDQPEHVNTTDAGYPHFTIPLKMPGSCKIDFKVGDDELYAPTVTALEAPF